MLNMLEIWSRFEFTNENREPSEKHVFPTLLLRGGAVCTRRPQISLMMMLTIESRYPKGPCTQKAYALALK